MNKIFGLLVGGLLGTGARYCVSRVLHPVAAESFPYATFAVNLSGCFLAGLIVAFNNEKFFLTPEMQLFLITGFLGAYTTFSALILETVSLWDSGRGLVALANLFLSVLVGLMAFKAGMLTTRLFS